MAPPSRPRRGDARENPEEGYYSGLHSGSEVPTACPSQLFKVWLCGRVRYQWNADSLLVLPLSPSHPPSRSLPSPSLSLSFRLTFAFSGFTTCRMQELARRCFKGSSPFSPLTTMAVQMQSCDLGNSSYPAPFSVHRRRRRRRRGCCSWSTLSRTLISQMKA